MTSTRNRITFQYHSTETGEACTPREVLGFVANSWLYGHEIEKGRRLARIGTDAECADYLTRIEDLASHRLAQWRWSQ